jgi:hypothetical protein
LKAVDVSKFMVRIMGQGDYLVPQTQGKRLRNRLRDADTLPLEERNAAVQELIAEVIRDGGEAPKGSAPDLVLAVLPPEVVRPQQPGSRPAGDKIRGEIRQRRERWHDGEGGRGVGYPGPGHDSLRDIDPTDRPRG